MIKATIDSVAGRKMLILGLSFENLDRLRENACDGFIKVDGEKLALPMDVLIYAGQTEAHCAEVISAFIGPNTNVEIDPRSKQ